MGNLTILAGQNGSGKSNIIDTLKFIRDALVYDLDRAVSERHGIDSIRQWSPSRPYHISISADVTSPDGSGYFSLTLGSSKGRYLIIKEEAEWTGGDDEYYFAEEHDDEPEIVHVEMTTKYVRDRSGKVSISQIKRKDDQIHTSDDEIEIPTSMRDDLILSSYRLVQTRGKSSGMFYGLRALQRALANIEAYSIFPNTLRAPQVPSNDRILHSNGDNLTSIFREMPRTRSGSEAKSEILSSLQSFIPVLDNVTIQSVGGYMVPTFRIREISGQSHVFNVSQISDGTLRVLGLLAALYQVARPSLIAMEEPEQNINPGVLAILADSIKDVSRNTQIVLTTHSPNFIDLFPVEAIRAVELKEGMTTLGPINEAQVNAIKENLFSLGEIMAFEGLAVK